MIGAIIGDISGSSREHSPIKTTDFRLFTSESRFTDETVLNVAIASAILNGGSYKASLASFAERYPHAGYGSGFRRWFKAWVRKPYGSLGSGAASRVIPVGLAFTTEARVLKEAARSASCTHSHPDGIAGAQAVAMAVFMAKNGSSRNAIRSYARTHWYGARMSLNTNELRERHTFDSTALGSVPGAIIAFLDSTDTESAIRNAVSLGGDADTQACIAGGIAEAFYKEVDKGTYYLAMERIPSEFQDIVRKFRSRFSPWT